MEKYYNEKEDKTYAVEDVQLYGAIINVNGTSITDINRMYEITGNDLYRSGGYTVFVNSAEPYFDPFEAAYDYALNKQKHTFSI